MKNTKSSRSKAAELHREGAIITIDSLPEHLKAEFDQAVAQYHQQVDLQDLEPNHVQYREAIKATAEQLRQHIEKLRAIKIKYLTKDKCYIGDDDGIVVRDTGLPEGDYNMIPDETPSEVVDALIRDTEKQLRALEQLRAGLPIRRGGVRKDRAIRLFLSRVVTTYTSAGGTAEVHCNDSKTKFSSPFFTFAKEAVRRVRYTPQGDRAFAELLAEIRQSSNLIK